MRLNELLGLMDADEKVQLIYPDGEKLTGTAGRLFQLLGEAEASAQSPSGFGFWNKKSRSPTGIGKAAKKQLQDKDNKNGGNCQSHTAWNFLVQRKRNHV